MLELPNYGAKPNCHSLKASKCGKGSCNLTLKNYSKDVQICEHQDVMASVRISISSSGVLVGKEGWNGVYLIPFDRSSTSFCT